MFTEQNTPASIFNHLYNQLNSEQRETFMLNNSTAILHWMNRRPFDEIKDAASYAEAITSALNQYTLSHNSAQLEGLKNKIQQLFKENYPQVFATQQPKTPQPVTAPDQKQAIPTPSPEAKTASAPPKEAEPKRLERKQQLQRTNRQRFDRLLQTPLPSSEPSILGTKAGAQEVEQLIERNDRELGENNFVLIEDPPGTFTYAQALSNVGDKVICAISEQNIASIPKKNVFKIKISSSNIPLWMPITEPKIHLTREELGATGDRTGKMFNLLACFSNYVNGSLYINTKPFTPLTGNVLDISSLPTVSCGSSNSREMAIMDPAAAPLLNSHYDIMRSMLERQIALAGGNLDEEAILKFISGYIRREIFPPHDPDLVKKLAEFVEKQRSDSSVTKVDFRTEQGNTIKVPIIPIDTLIENHIGLCRHHAMVAAYFLDRYSKEPDSLCKGIVQHMRDNMGNGAHTWTTFMSASGKKWHFDTMWGLVFDFSDPHSAEILKNKYTPPIVESMIRRTHKAHLKATGNAIPPSI